MNSALADGIGYVGVAFTAASSVAQAVRIRSRGMEGVAPLTWTTLFAAMVFWLAYGIGTGLLPILIGNVICASAVGYTLWCIGVRRVAASLAFSAAVAFTICGIPAIIWGWDAGLPGAATLSICLCIPQIVDLYRTETAEGVSANAWIIGSISVLIWLGYAVAIQRWAVVIVDLVVLSANIFIATLAVHRHHALQRIESLSEV